MASPTASPAAIAAVEDVLKEVWVSDTLESQLQEDVLLYEWYDDTTEYTDADGLKASLPLRTGRTGGMSARDIGEDLGPPDHQKVGKASYNYKNLYLQIMVEGPVVARMETNRQSCVREIAFEIDNGLDDMKRDMQRQLHGFGDAAITIAGLPGNASSVTIPLGAGNRAIIDAGWLYEGQNIDIGTLASPQARTTGKARGSVQIVSIDEATPAIVVNEAVAVTAGDHIFLYGNRGAAAMSNVYSREINGLGNIVDDTTELGGIDPTDPGKGFWKSIVDDNSGSNRALSLSLMYATARKSRQRGGHLTDVWGSLGMEQAYYELLRDDVRFVNGTGNLGDGVNGPQFNNITFTGDPSAIPNRIYFLIKKHLFMLSAGGVEWQNQTSGGQILAWIQNKDAFMARAAKYCQTGTNKRRVLAVLDDITEPA